MHSGQSNLDDRKMGYSLCYFDGSSEGCTDIKYKMLKEIDKPSLHLLFYF